MNTQSIWRVESREAWSSKGSTVVYQVVREVTITQPNGISYQTTELLKNGKSVRWTREDLAQKACEAANIETA